MGETFRQRPMRRIGYLSRWRRIASYVKTIPWRRTLLHRAKNPLLLHPRQFELEREQLLITSHAIAGDRLLAASLQITSPSMELVGKDAKVPGDLRHVRAWQTGQTDSLAFELLAVTLSLLHDTPRAPSWGLTEVSVLAG